MNLSTYKQARYIGFSPKESKAKAQTDVRLNAPFEFRLSIESRAHQGPNNPRGRYIESASMTGRRALFRVVGEAHEIVRSIRHTGWCTSDDYRDVLVPVVLQMTGRNRKPRYLAAYRESDLDGFVVDLSDSTDDEIAAAYRADSMAERDAEKCREYNCAWRAGSMFADLGQNIRDMRREALEILGARKGLSGPDILCATIRRRISEILAAIKFARNERELLESGDWEDLCFYPSPELRAAFNEGAGRS